MAKYNYDSSSRRIVKGTELSLAAALSIKLKEQSAYMDKKTLREIPHFSQLKNNIKGAKLFVNNLMQGMKTRFIGDYDMDGMAGTSICKLSCEYFGFGEELIDFVIPSRLKDGYGLSKGIVEKAIADGVEMIVTVDNGIAAVDAIKLAKDAGIVVIITDHHTSPEVLPEADVIINPRVPGETLPYTYISGATVAWYFMAAVKNELGSNLDLLQFMDLLALTVMSDVMPLDNINLAFLKKGLEIIRKRDKKLYQLIWSETWHAKEEIDETGLSFMAVPMFNALGRIADANEGVDLFTSHDQKEITDIYYKMKEINEKRKDLSRNSTETAELYLEHLPETESNICIVKGEYHEGVVGIIAGRVAEIHTKPAIVFSYNEESGLFKGSARTVGDIHLYDFIFQASEFIAYGGGHAGAVGLAVHPDNFDAFKEKLERLSMEIPPEKFINKNLIPIEVNLPDMTDDVFKVLRENGPYGNTNPKPTFISEGIISDLKPLRDGLHYEVTITDPETNFKINALFFNIRKKEEFLEKVESGIVKFSFQNLLKFKNGKHISQISAKLI